MDETTDKLKELCTEAAKELGADAVVMVSLKRGEPDPWNPEERGTGIEFGAAGPPSFVGNIPRLLRDLANFIESREDPWNQPGG